MTVPSAEECSTRVASLQDIEALTGLAWELLQHHAQLSAPGVVALSTYSEFRQVWVPYVLDLIRDPDSAAIMAEQDGCLVGYALLALRSHPPVFLGPPDLIIAEVLVVPELRRRGVGTRLMAAAYDWGRRRGAGYARLHVYEGNEGAIRFYEREGFCPRERVLVKRLSDDPPA